ncbi:MAG: hypothetical protein IJS90_03795 [Clostridia bacterium]|nr:hypothetical protein [Clostridia bacterium]
MKKMPYAIIFIVLLAVLVFAGCKTMISTSSETDTQDEEITETEPEETVSTQDPLADLNIEELTDENGETLFSPEEISSMQEEYSSMLAEMSSSTTTSGSQDQTAAADTSTTEKSGASSTTRSSSENTTKSQAAETTTKPSSSSRETTTKRNEENTTKAPVNNTSEYDILRSGHFYMDGTMYADGESNPVTLAVGDDLVYMQTTMDGATMGFLISGSSTYLLNPTDKTYCEFGAILSGILSQAGMMSQDEIMEYINEMGFSSMGDLNKADQVSNATLNGTACKVYIFNKSDGSKTRVFMNGNKLLGFEIVSADNQVETATYLKTITSTIPTLPPKDYTKQNIVSFMTSMDSLIQD